MARALTQVTATGNIVAGRSYLHSLSVTAAADAATVALRDGSGNAVKLTLSAPIGTSVVWNAGDREGVQFTSAIHVTVVAGTGVLVSGEYS